MRLTNNLNHHFAYINHRSYNGDTYDCENVQKKVGAARRSTQFVYNAKKRKVGFLDGLRPAHPAGVLNL